MGRSQNREGAENLGTRGRARLPTPPLPAGLLRRAPPAPLPRGARLLVERVAGPTLPGGRVRVRTCTEPGPGVSEAHGSSEVPRRTSPASPPPGGVKSLCFLLEGRPASFYERWQIKVSLSSLLFPKPVETRMQSPSREPRPALVLSRFQQLQTAEESSPEQQGLGASEANGLGAPLPPASSLPGYPLPLPLGPRW